MKVKVAKTAGFCMGVRRAMDLALSAARERHPEEIIQLLDETIPGAAIKSTPPLPDLISVI